jgi:hypothetical protein
MEVKGLAFIARKKLLIAKIGDEKFKEFMNELGRKEPYFKHYDDIVAMSSIPADKFLFFNDVVLREFYDNDPRVYWMMGEKSAEYALVDGPFKVLIQKKNIERVLTESIPIIWKMYYTAGDLDIKYEPGVFDVSVVHLPINHYYFEYVVMGYCNKILELCGAKSITCDKIKTVDKGDKDINYIFHFTV